MPQQRHSKYTPAKRDEFKSQLVGLQKREHEICVWTLAYIKEHKLPFWMKFTVVPFKWGTLSLKKPARRAARRGFLFTSSRQSPKLTGQFTRDDLLKCSELAAALATSFGYDVVVVVPFGTAATDLVMFAVKPHATTR